MPDYDPALLARVLEHVPDNIFLLDAQQRIVYINHAVPGVTVEEMLGVKQESLLPPDQLQIAAEALNQARETRETTRYEVRYEAPTGTRTFEARVRAVYEADQHLGWAISSTDISSHIDISQDFQRFFDMTDELLAIVDDDGNFLRASPSFSALGVAPESLVGRSHFDLIHPDDHAAVREAMSQPRAQVEFRICHPDGPELIIAGWFARSDAHGGRIYGAARDVTEARALERQLLRRQKLEVVGQLAGGVAHDFNNMLLSVLINATHALEELDTDHPAAEYIRDLREAAQLSADLTKQLMAFSRRRSHRPRELDLNELTNSTLQVLRRTIPASIDIDFIPGHGLGWIHADAGQVEQVLLNLSLNARDAMPAGGRLTLSTQNVLINGAYRRTHPWARAGRYILLTVSDTGVGIPPELRETIFEPFFSTRDSGTAAGLGLTIVHDVVQRHNGMINVYSEPGMGTIFKVYLPLSTVAASDMPSAPEGPVPAGKQETVLLAEDERLVQRVVSRILKRAGYRVIVVDNGRDALQELDEGAEVDLLLLDVVMPVMSGPEVVRTLRKRGADIPVVLASGYSDEMLEGDALEGVPLIGKPYEPDALLRLLRHQLDTHRSD